MNSIIYVGMDAKSAAKRYKQQILSFCVRHGKCFEGKGHWTNKHRAWLTSLDFGNTLLQETFQEYLRLLDQTLESLERFENKINELANSERYAERTRRLNCFLGIANVIALAVLAEVGTLTVFLLPVSLHPISDWFLASIPAVTSAAVQA